MVDYSKTLTKIGIEVFKGKVFKKIEGMVPGSDEVTFVTDQDEMFVMYHEQDCCEHVELNDVCGEVANLFYSPILQAEEVSNQEGIPEEDCEESCTWTFYKLATIKGSVTLRWLGTSNGYYSEEVDLVRVEN